MSLQTSKIRCDCNFFETAAVVAKLWSTKRYKVDTKILIRYLTLYLCCLQRPIITIKLGT